MADKDTLNLIKFKFGSFQSIKDLSSKDQSSFYFASDAPAFYNAGLWYGVSSLTSSVNEETGEVTLVINGGFGDNWKSSQVTHKFVAGMTKKQKADLEKAVSFVNSVTSTEGEDTQTIIDKWNEIVAFLAGFEETDVLLNRITTLETNVGNLQKTKIIGGDGLAGGGDLSGGDLTIGLGTPSTIADDSTNSVTKDSHTHAINKASTEQRGIVRLNNSLESDSTDQALTAKQGKVLKEHIDEMFELIDNGNGVKEIKAKYGLWSNSFISARGVDNESGGVGGLDAQAVWDLLMQNDDVTKIINVSHIPDITVAKITDFTAKVGDLIANKADKATTLSGYGIKDALQCMPFNESSLDLNELSYSSVWDGLHPLNRPSGAYGYSSILALAYQPDLRSQLYFDHYKGTIYRRNNQAGTWLDWSVILDTANASSHVVDLTSDQTISGVKTFSNLRVNNSTMVTNLNAEMVGGMTTRNFVKQDYRIDANAYNENSVGYGYQDGGWRTSGPALNIGSVQGYSMLMQMDAWDGAIYTRRRVKGVLGESWKQLAFTDTNSLTPSNGTLTINGNLTATSIEGDLKPILITGDVAQEAKPNRFLISKSNATNLPNGELYLTGFSLLQDENANFKSIFAISSQNNVYVKTANFQWAKLAQENSHVTFKNITADYISVYGSIDIGTNAHIYGKLTVSNQLTIGNATLYWDVANQCLRVNAGIASDSFLSAKGVDTTGNGQGGGGGFDATMLWNELTIPSPTNSGKVISSQFLPVQEILTPVASDISEINAEIIALQDRIANIEQALTWQTL